MQGQTKPDQATQEDKHTYSVPNTDSCAQPCQSFLLCNHSVKVEVEILKYTYFCVCNFDWKF